MLFFECGSSSFSDSSELIKNPSEQSFFLFELLKICSLLFYHFIGINCGDLRIDVSFAYYLSVVVFSILADALKVFSDNRWGKDAFFFCTEELLDQ